LSARARRMTVFVWQPRRAANSATLRRARTLDLDLDGELPGTLKAPYSRTPCALVKVGSPVLVPHGYHGPGSTGNDRLMRVE
jgi:hypothetical protein